MMRASHSLILERRLEVGGHELGLLPCFAAHQCVEIILNAWILVQALIPWGAQRTCCAQLTNRGPNFEFVAVSKRWLNALDVALSHFFGGSWARCPGEKYPETQALRLY